MWTICLGGSSVIWVPKLLLTPVKIRIFGSKTAKFGPKLKFLAKYRHFWPIWFGGRQKSMQTRCLGGFSVIWVPKLLLTPINISFFGQKTAKFGPNYAFVIILGQILAFLSHFIPCPTKKQCKWLFCHVNRWS